MTVADHTTTDAVQELFFGCAADQIADDVVLTPIPAFYSALLADADHVEEHRGWWRLATATTAGRRHSVVLHFEGTRVADAVVAVTGPATRLGFLGLAGGLDPDLDIGTTVRLSGAHRRGEPPVDALTDWPGPLPAVRAVTGNGLLDDVADTLRAAGAVGADVVDLESYFFFQACRRADAAGALALVTVSDQPARRPFWDVALDDDDLAEAGRRMRRELHDWWTAPRAGEEL